MPRLGLAQDAAHALRFLRFRPGFAAAVIIALALGIGANAALFTVLNALLFRPFPYQNPEELVEVTTPGRTAPVDELRSARSLSAVAALVPAGLPVSHGGAPPAQVYSMRVTANLFDTLGVRAAIGRTPGIGEDAPGAPRVAVLAHDYWRRNFGDSSILGDAIAIDGEKHTVIGVMPEGFFVWFADANIFIPGRVNNGRVIARLGPGVTVEQAGAEVKAIGAGLPGGPGGSGRREPVEVAPLDRAFRVRDVSSLLLLQAAVGLVLLITCANAGNLMLVRGSARRREFAIRTALGAGAPALLRQLLAESMVLATAGGALGIGVASMSARLIGPLLPANFSRLLGGADPLAVDLRVIAFSAGAAALTVVLFGLGPALASVRFDVVTHLKDSARGGAPRRQRFTQAIVAAEIALAVMLLTGAGLMLKSVLLLASQDLGFDARGVLRAAVALPRRHAAPDAQNAAYARVVERVRGLPGVESVALFAPQFFPFGGPGVRGARFEMQEAGAGEPRAEVYVASPEYFRLVRIPIMRGRGFRAADTGSSEPVALVSQAVARRHFRGDAVGQRIRLNAGDASAAWVTVIGVVGDVRNPVGADVQPTLYLPFAQRPSSSCLLLVRTQGDPMALAPAVRREWSAFDSAAQEPRMADLGRAVAAYINPQRFLTSMLGGFAGAGLLLAAVGVYGVMRYWVVNRIPEMGIRVALGAQRADVFRVVVARAAWTALAGVAAGAAGALALQRVIASQLHGVSPADPVVLGAVCATAAGVAMVAAALPARMAARIDPLAALRDR